MADSSGNQYSDMPQYRHLLFNAKPTSTYHAD